MDCFLSFNTVGFSSPLLPCRPVDLRRGLIYSENLQHNLSFPSHSPHLFRLHFCNQFAFPSLGVLTMANI